MAKDPLPPRDPLPWYWRTVWRAWDLLTWPLTARKLRAAGFRRTGWRTWESGPDDSDPGWLLADLADGRDG